MAAVGAVSCVLLFLLDLSGVIAENSFLGWLVVTFIVTVIAGAAALLANRRIDWLRRGRQRAAV